MSGAADSDQRCSKFDSMVGHSNEGNIFLDGHPCRALLDTGANVSTLSLSKYHKLFKDLPIHSLDEFALDIEGAGGQKLPYVGFIEVEVSTPELQNRVPTLMLVVPDTKFAERVPVILGTNVLKKMLEHTRTECGDRFQQKLNLPDSWSLAFRCMKIQTRQLQRAKGRLCVMRNASNNKVVIPSNSRVMIPSGVHNATTSSSGLGMTQRFSNSGSRLDITPTLLNVDRTGQDRNHHARGM